MKNLIKNTFIAAVISIASDKLFAGESDPRAMAMGRAQTAVAQNTEAYMWNPANLGLDLTTKNKMTVSAFAFGFRVGNNLLGISDYNHYNGRTFTTNDKAKFLDLFGSDRSLNGSLDGEARALGFQYRNYAVNFEFGGDGFIEVPKQVFDVVLSPSAYVLGDQSINAKGRGSGSALLTIAASAGFPIKNFLTSLFHEFSVGASVKYIHGYGQFTMKDLNASVEQGDSLIVHARYAGRESTGGNGVGFNFGVAAQINKRWSAGISVQNIYSQVKWKANTKIREADFTVRSQDLFEAGKKKNQTTSDTTYRGQAYTTKLPSILHAGAAYQMNKKTLFAFDYEQFLDHEKGKTLPRLAAGAEFRTWEHVCLRTGMSVGGDNRGFNIAGGVGFILNKTLIDIATNNIEGFIISRRFSFALSVKIAIP